MVTDLLRSRSAAAAGPSVPSFLVRRAAACAEASFPAPGAIVVTSGAGAWTFGAWVALGTPAQDLVLNYLHAINYTAAPGLVPATIELAYGAAYTPLDAGRETASLFNPGPTTAWSLPLSQMCQPVVCPAGQTLYARAADSSPAAFNYEVLALGWLAGLPTFDVRGLTTISGPGRWYPANTTAAGITVIAAVYPSYGAGVTVVDPAPNDLLVVGLVSQAALSYLLDTGTLWQIGYGPAGSETWCSTSLAGRLWNERWIWPPVLVRAGERLAVRASWYTGGSRTCQVKVYDV
jgi:hypothetical protein